MSIRIDEALGVHERALGLRMQRSEILAANLANEDTPGFQARDIDFSKEMQRLDSSTSPRASCSSLSPSRRGSAAIASSKLRVSRPFWNSC